MADEQSGLRLSGSFNENAKDDPRAAARRMLEKHGDKGKEEFQKLELQRNHLEMTRHESEIEQTAARRYDAWVNKRVEQSSAPAPGKKSQPLTPGAYEQIKREGHEWLRGDTAERERRLREEIDQQFLKVAERAAARLEKGPNLGQDRSQDQGRGRT